MRRRGALIAVALAMLATPFALGVRGASAASTTRSAIQRSTAATTNGRCRGALTLPTHSNRLLIDTAVTCLIDRERAHERLPALRPNRQLQGIASSLATEMAADGYFGDDSVVGQTPWERITASPYAVGSQIVAAAQNIGWGTGGLATPEGIVEQWMRSMPHRAIILSGGYRDFGAGVQPIAPSSVTDEKPSATYTVEFAARA